MKIPNSNYRQFDVQNGHLTNDKLFIFAQQSRTMYGRTNGISFKNILWCFVITIQLLLFGYVIYKYLISSGKTPTDKSWDVLLFVQSWPISYCSQWMEQAVKNKCSLPQNNNSWTVHGIWPTKTGTTGPTFCPLSLGFNRTALLPIERDLNTSWTAIQFGENPYKFWKHEWQKHGKCAYNDTLLDSELKYFKQGLNWLQQYNMRDIFNEAGILPNSNFNATYNVSLYWDAIKNKIQKDPFISCYYDKTIKHHFIIEVYICFDRQLNMVDCNMKSNTNNGIVTNCPLKKPVLFPSVVPNKPNNTVIFET